MRTFTCYCGNRLYFENSICLKCGRLTGFDSTSLTLSAFDARPDGTWLALNPNIYNQVFQRCRNGIEYDTCNWMVEQCSTDSYCISCRMNELIPDLTLPRRKELWFKVEQAKRRLIYTLLALRLPVLPKRQFPNNGLAFRVLADERLDADSIDVATFDRVTTGHYFGCITLNLMEADDSKREQMRERMNERYRTLLGHFRHEAGHYYWFLLVDNGPMLAPFRELFGDERQDYAAAIAMNQPPPGASDTLTWRDQYISRYASVHPWEDFGETWAHYMHMIDTLETAWDANFEIEGKRLHSPLEDRSRQFDLEWGTRPDEQGKSFPFFLDDWLVLSSALNRLNRSMGLKDAYPFLLSEKIMEKLGFVHRLIQSSTF